jgi:hypothetical protein
MRLGTTSTDCRPRRVRYVEFADLLLEEATVVCLMPVQRG